jgi:6-phosphogluconolactonase
MCTIALSGGSTPKRLFELLAARGRDALPWDDIELWWGDERCVPPDHADSNYRMAREALIDPLGLTRVHRMPAEQPDAAVAYERDLVAALGTPPVIDYMMLGMGSDGHTASLFPFSPGLDERKRWVIANSVDSPLTHGKTTRITLTVPAILAARNIRFLVAGSDKAEALHAVLEGPRDTHRYPSQLIAEHATWLVDRAAASRVRDQ